MPSSIKLIKNEYARGQSEISCIICADNGENGNWLCAAVDVMFMILTNSAQGF